MFAIYFIFLNVTRDFYKAYKCGLKISSQKNPYKKLKEKKRKKGVKELEILKLQKL